MCIQKLPVTLCLDRAGLVGEDGPTHHGAFDLSFLRHIPNIKILAPRDEPELQAALITSLNLGQPLVIRYPRGSAPGRPLPNAEPLISLPPLPLGEGELLRAGTDAVVIAVGSMVVAAQNAAERLFTETGRSVAVFDARWIKPLPEKQLLDLVARFRPAYCSPRKTPLPEVFLPPCWNSSSTTEPCAGNASSASACPTLLWSTARKPSSATALALMTRASI